MTAAKQDEFNLKIVALAIHILNVICLRVAVHASVKWQKQPTSKYLCHGKPDTHTHTKEKQKTQQQKIGCTYFL